MEVKKMIESQISALQQDIAESLAKIEGLSKNIDIYTPLESVVDEIFEEAKCLKESYSALKALSRYKICKDLADGKVVENIFEAKKS